MRVRGPGGEPAEPGPVGLADFEQVLVAAELVQVRGPAAVPGLVRELALVRTGWAGPGY